MTTMMYTLQNFNDITFNGFDIQLPEETLQLITELAQQVGSPTYIRTPIFEKKEQPTPREDANNFSVFRKKRRNRNADAVQDEDWESLRSFQATKMEQKVGIDGQIDAIRSCLNKMSDKNYQDQCDKILEILKVLIENETSQEEMNRIGKAIFEIASNNRFYSKIYAELYTRLIEEHEMMNTIFQDNLNSFLELFKQIESVDPEVDYDRFCKVNENNEKRRALSAFFVNLLNKKIITKEKMIEITLDLMRNVVQFIKEDNKKNEVDEITENIAILYNKEVFEKCSEKIDGLSMHETIEKLAKCKVKMFPSLSNKSIFKYMDLIDM
jgi:hypothetical protein